MDLRAVLLNLNDENVTKLYKEYKQPIFLFILGITKDYALSEDITEEVFIRILKYHKTYNGFKNPKTWIYTIAKNTTYTFLKKRAEISTEDIRLEFLFNQHNTVKNGDSLLIEEYLSHLSEVERNLVILHIFNGLTHLEISNVLKMNYSHVRARYSYAMKKLKEKVKESEYGI